MESQSYKTFISEFKWISKWQTWPPKIRMKPQFWFFAHLNDHWRICSAMPSMISWWANFFLSLSITFKTNAQINIIPSPCSIFFALRLKWCLNLSTDKKSDAVCIFANLCFTLFSLSFKFYSAWFYFLSKCTKKRGKSNREKFTCR